MDKETFRSWLVSMLAYRYKTVLKNDDFYEEIGEKLDTLIQAAVDKTIKTIVDLKDIHIEDYDIIEINQAIKE